MSPFVRKVMITAHETGLLERVTLVRSLVAMNAANSDVMRDNPLSKIPTLVTADGEALFDSDVICEYLDSLSGRKLIPVADAERWHVLRWNALGSGMLDALVLWRNERMRPEAHQSQPTLATYAKKIEATLGWLEAAMPALERSPFGLGHIAIGCAFGYLDLRFEDIDWRSAQPASARWFASFMERPSAKATVPAAAEAFFASRNAKQQEERQP
jgi:glutathione S-transferase